MDLPQIARQIKDAPENIFLIYAFNATGKTRLSVEYKEAARNEQGRQTGVYYIQEDSLEVYHLALLRQILENIASFLGVGQFQYVLQQIGFTEESGKMADIINALTHQKVYYPQAGVMVPDNKRILVDVFNALMGKYHFVLHND